MAEAVRPEDFDEPELTWGNDELGVEATGQNDPAVAELKEQRRLARDRKFLVDKEVGLIVESTKADIKPPKHLDDPIHARELPLPDPRNNRSDKDHPWYEGTSELPN